MNEYFKNLISNKKTLISILLLVLLSSVITIIELIIVNPTLDIFADKGLVFLTLNALTFLFILILFLYVINNHSDDRHISRTLGLIFTALTITVLLSFVMKEFVNDYAMPIALCGLILVLLSDKKIAIFSTVIAAQLIFIAYSVTAAYGISSSTLTDATAVVTALAGGLIMVFFISQNYTRVWLISLALFTGIVMGLFASLSVAIESESLMFRVVLSAGLWTVAGSAISVTLAMVLLPIIEKVFGLVSNFSLMEYCSFDNPILKRLKDEAPGTFNHSLVVGNLAEHCALAIGKNPALARAAAYYHDVGKLKNPEFFIENQQDGINPHDLIPEVSVSMITQHADEGYKLLTKHNFPKIISDVSREHHGDSPVQFFYYKAQSITEGKLNSEQYRYKGPKPRSVTSAIVMIADIVEASSRTKGAMSHEEITAHVETLIKEKIGTGQFEDCPITMKDLNIIKKTIVNVLPGFITAG